MTGGVGESFECCWKIKGIKRKHDHTAMCITIVKNFLLDAAVISFICSKVQVAKKGFC